MKNKLFSLASKITGIVAMIVIFFSTILATELIDLTVDEISDKLD